MAGLNEDKLINAAEAEILADLSPDAAPASAQSLFGKSVANMALRSFSMAARFLLMIGLAHYLAPADVGIFTLMYASTTLGILLLGARFDVYSTRAICSNERTNPAVIIRDQIIFHLLVYALILPLMLLVFAAHILPWQLVGWFYILLILEHAGQECNRLFVALGQPLRATFVFFVRSGAWAAVVIPLMFYAPSYRSLQIVWVLWTAGGIACLLVSGFWMRSLGWRVAMKEPIDWQWIRRGLKPSASYTVAIGATQLISTLDRYFLAATWKPEFVGVYGFYSNLTNFVPTFAETGIVSIVLPTLLLSAAAKDAELYKRTLGKLTKGVWIICGATSLLACALGPIVLMLVKKSPIYSQFLPAFAILVSSAVVFTLTNIPHNALYANHRDYEIARWSVAALITAVICYAALTPTFGIYGVCFGSLVSSAVILAGKWWESRKLAL
jgi:O-antigen/teichoic acid export membrane protein